MKLGLGQKVVIVTGASFGIGLELARLKNKLFLLYTTQDH
jgi:short-subunit dehydrogenase